MRASGILRGPDKNAINRIDNKTEFVEKIRLALYASKIVSYAQVNQQNVLQIGPVKIQIRFLFQGFMLLREAAENFKWKLNYGGIALMWRGGCIIRSAFLGKIK